MPIIEHGELLAALWLTPGAPEIDQELARMALCKKLGLPPTVPDEALLRLVRHCKAAAESHLPVQAEPAPTPAPAPGKTVTYADPAELAKIPRTSLTGLKAIVAARSSHQGLRFANRQEK